MIIESFEQKSEEWIKAHMGIPTASAFSKILTPGGKLSEQSVTYMHELLAQHLTGQYEEGYKSEWMERGTDMEKEARAYYELLTDREVTPVGFIYKDEQRLTGCSPDGLVNDIDGGIEIKCPKASTHIKYLLAGDMPTIYIPQVQGSMWIAEKEQWDWLSYHPGLPPVLLRVLRDEPYVKKLGSAITEFIDRMLTQREKLRGNL